MYMTADELLPLTAKEKTHYTNWWCRTIGIKSRDLDNHPQIDDAIRLIQFRDTLWYWMSASERGEWAAMWNRVYHNQYPLKAQHWNRLESITLSSMYRQEQNNKKATIIRQLRESRTKQGSVHMMANPLPATSSPIRT